MHGKFHLTMKSSNAKTGPIPVSTSTGETCPKSCPFNSSNEGGCYAESGPLAIHWKAVTDGKRGVSWNEFLAMVRTIDDGALWRHDQAGDLPGIGNHIAPSRLIELVHANKGKRGFTYTHKPTSHKRNREAIKHANDNGFTVNLSANNLSEVDGFSALGIGPVVVVVPSDMAGKRKHKTDGGLIGINCPATYREDVTCKSCGLCQKVDRKFFIAFPAHGTGAKKASKVAS